MKRTESVNSGIEQRKSNQNGGRKKKRQFTKVIKIAGLALGCYILCTNVAYFKTIKPTDNKFDNKVKLNFLGNYLSKNGTSRKHMEKKRLNQNNNESELLPSEASSLPLDQPQKLQEDDIIESVKTNIEKEEIGGESWSSESSVFRHMLKRARTNFKACGTATNWNESYIGKFTNMSYLPKFGIVKALSDHLSGKNINSTSYPYKCSLPPPKSCNEKGYSVVLLTHDLSDRFRVFKLCMGIKKLVSRPLTKEIILVWNGKKEDFNNPRLLEWSENKTHPLRIFHHNLGNDLFNRWHPDINPKMDAVLYFDDDGPFFDETAVEAGFELWKRNSDVPVAAYYRNFRFKSEYQINNIQGPMQSQMNLAVEQVEQEWQNLSPYDTSSFSSVQSNYPNAQHPSFVPFCSSCKRDLEYNFYTFPSFGSHMFLPSGAIIHKKFLCFLWHPVFQQVRDYVTHHPTHADDVTVSTLTSQITGKAFRVYPMRLTDVVVEETTATPPPAQNISENQSRRKLLWEQQDWPNLRTEAINSITGYFGSLSPGSVGWCVGTDFFNKKDKKMKWLDQSCTEEFPNANKIPWFVDGGLGFNQC